MASLYNISEDILRIFGEIELNDGEVTDEQYDALCIKQEELKEKLNAYVKAVKEFQSSADFCKKEKQAINTRQNVYKNRVERLKNAMLEAVHNFGEYGKNNMFIELPTCRIFTKSSTSVNVNEERISILLRELGRYIRELVKNDVLYTGDDIDMQGILDSINSNVIAEMGEGFEPFTMSDLTSIRININDTATIYDMFKNHREALVAYGSNTITCNIDNATSLDDWKVAIKIADNNNVKPSVAKIVKNDSLQIK